MSLKILIADDHPIFRKGMKDIVQVSFKDIIIDECSDGATALRMAIENNYDLVVLDVEMPEYNGLKACQTILAHSDINSQVVILTMYKNDEIFYAALDSGAKGFVLKDNSAEEIIQCLNDVLNGKQYISHFFKDKIYDYYNLNTHKSHVKNLLNSLTETELKTLMLVSQNYTSQEICDLLFVTKKTVENYRSRICKKLDLNQGNNSLLKWALENKEMIKMMNE